jgi:hypothetical protein
MKKIIGSSIVILLLILPVLSVRAETETETEDPQTATGQQAEWKALTNKEKEQRAIEALRLKGIKLDIKASSTEDRQEEHEVRVSAQINRASTTERKWEEKENRFDIKYDRNINRASTTRERLENREMDIERIRERLASTTASTSSKRIEQINDRLEKQREQMKQVRERLVEKELKVLEVLGQIASKIQERITILAAKGLDMTAAKAKLAEASLKIEEITAAGQSLTVLIETEITEANKDQLMADVKTAQEKIRGLAQATHALLVDTIKEITKVLPARPTITSTTTPPAGTN